MPFFNKLSFARNGGSVRQTQDRPSHGYACQAIEAMRHIHNSFVAMAENLKVALQKKLITDKEYNDWMRCFHSLQDDWLKRDVDTPDDILFLQWMAESSIEAAKRFGKAGY